MPEHHLNGKPRPWHDDVLDASRAIFAETKALIREESLAAMGGELKEGSLGQDWHLGEQGVGAL